MRVWAYLGKSFDWHGQFEHHECTPSTMLTLLFSTLLKDFSAHLLQNMNSSLCDVAADGSKPSLISHTIDREWDKEMIPAFSTTTTR